MLVRTNQNRKQESVILKSEEKKTQLEIKNRLIQGQK